MTTVSRPARLARLVPVLVLLGAAPAEPPALVQAARDRDLEGVSRLIREGADVDARQPDGATALHWAAYWDDVEMARVLLRAGADARAANDLGATPLWSAAMNGSATMVGALLEAGADPNAPLLSGETPVMTAARTGDPEVLELLLDAGGDPDARGTRGQTALMWAVAQGHEAALRVLLEHGADVDLRTDTWSQAMAVPPHSDPANQQNVPHGGYTALLFAARVGELESARLLIAAGADVDAVDAWGVSAMTLAAHSGFGDIVQELLEAGADPNAAGAGFSALHLAVLRRDDATARALLTHGADANARLANWTPTRRASNDWHIHPSLVGATPFWIAARLTQPVMMRLLVEHGADPRFVHRVDWVATAGAFGFGTEARSEATTALMAAVGMGGPRGLGGFVDPERSQVAALRLEAVAVALELGVDVDAVDLQGRTALDATNDQAIAALLAAAAAR